MEIVFINTLDVLDVFTPQPAFQMIPNWYKETQSYVNDEKKPNGSGGGTGTIKRCMPVFDALNSGYLLITHTDIWVSQKENEFGKMEAWYEWPSFSPIQFHPSEQAPLYPGTTGSPVPKWMNPWGIKTPKGYSTLFTAPFHRENIFVALPAVVDTDNYISPVNIIFTLANPQFEGMVPAGTPICQVIPFKRDNWKMSIGAEKELKDIKDNQKKLHTRIFDSYKNQFRETKQYK